MRLWAVAELNSMVGGVERAEGSPIRHGNGLWKNESRKS